MTTQWTWIVITVEVYSIYQIFVVVKMCSSICVLFEFLQYYAITSGGADPTEMKRHLKQCSRHRDKYCFQTHTPPG